MIILAPEALPELATEGPERVGAATAVRNPYDPDEYST